MPRPKRPDGVPGLFLRKANSDLAANDDVPRTHDINLLLRLLAKNGVDIPSHLTAARLLSPWAVAMRYDDIEETLDRAAAVEAATAAIGWARDVLPPTASERQ